MEQKKRLGPQDPLGWIRDTRKPESGYSAREENRSALKEPAPIETRREIVHKDKTIPMEVKVTLKGQPVKQTITLEITVGEK